MNGTIENYNVDISVINRSSKSNCVKNIDSVLKARKDLKEYHYRDKLLIMLVSTAWFFLLFLLRVH